MWVVTAVKAWSTEDVGSPCKIFDLVDSAAYGHASCEAGMNSANLPWQLDCSYADLACQLYKCRQANFRTGCQGCFKFVSSQVVDMRANELMQTNMVESCWISRCSRLLLIAQNLLAVLCLAKTFPVFQLQPKDPGISLPWNCFDSVSEANSLSKWDRWICVKNVNLKLPMPCPAMSWPSSATITAAIALMCRPGDYHSAPWQVL